MNITNDQINPEIRQKGVWIRRLLHFKNERSFVRTQKVLIKVRRFMKTKKMTFTEKKIQTDDNKNLRLCVYTALETQPKATGLLWIHGGGYGLGTPEQDIGFIQEFIDTENCVVVSPDYRLSIDAPYPAAVNDCYQALLWMKNNAATLGIREDQLFVGGDSAGGGLTAAVTLMARDKEEVNIAFQMPFYPMIDDRMRTPSAQNNDAPVWNSSVNKIAWKLYLGELFATDHVPAYAAPAREINYANLPPAYTFVGDIEPFYDETKNYIAALKKAGVPAEMDIYAGCFHGFDQICAKSPISKKATETYLRHFSHAVTTYFVTQP